MITLLLALACATPTGPETDTDTDSPIDATADADSDADTDSDADADADSDADADADSDADADADADTGTTSTSTGQTAFPPGCGDLGCDVGEDCANCPVDCGACPPGCVADGRCDAADGETCTSCPADCDTPAADVCGNGQCDGSETDVTCMADCGPSPWPSAWAAYEAEVVVEMNAYRAAGTDCPSGPKSAVGPLTMDPMLQDAARLHSWDQAYSDYFAHDSCNGREPWDRAADAGTSATSEVIAWNHPTPASAVAGWMASPTGHCDAVMSGTVTVVGVGYAEVQSPHLWTALFR